MGRRLVNGAALALYGGSFGARLAGRRPAGVGLALAGTAVASAGGYLGGHLAIARDVGSVDPRLRPEGPEPGSAGG